MDTINRIEHVAFAQRDALNLITSLRNVSHMCALRAYCAANRCQTAHRIVAAKHALFTQSEFIEFHGAFGRIREARAVIDAIP